MEEARSGQVIFCASGFQLCWALKHNLEMKTFTKEPKYLKHTNEEPLCVEWGLCLLKVLGLENHSNQRSKTPARPEGPQLHHIRIH